METSLVVIHNPFERSNRDVRVLDITARPTVSQLLADYAPNAPELVVSINGVVITEEEWGNRELCLGEQLVVTPKLQKGGILAAILTILVVIYAPYLVNFLAQGAWVGAVAGSFAATGLGIAMTIGISMIGGYLVNALVGPSKPSLPGLQSYDSSPTYSWQPLTTQTAGTPVVKAYGTLKLYGNIIAGYIENTGDSGQLQYANVLLDLGMGPYDTLSDFTINDQDLSVYKGVTVVTRMGNLDQEVIPAFNDTPINRSMSTKVLNGAPVIWTTPGNQYDALEVVLTCPNGLYHANNSGGLDLYSINVVVEVSSDSGATWVPFSQMAGTTSVSSTNRWSYGRWVALGTTGGLMPRLTFWSEFSAGSSVYTDHDEGETTPADEFTGRYFWRWILAGDEYSAVANTYNYNTLQGKSPQPIRRTYKIVGCNRGTTYKVRITNNTADITDSKWADDVYLTSVNEIAYDDFQYPRSVLVAIRALGTDQLSGSFKFSCIAKASIVRVWNGSAWVSEHNNNPAWVTWDILTQPVFRNDLTVARYDGFDPSRIDLVSFYAWAQWCDYMVPAAPSGTEKRCTFDGVFETTMTMWETALEVCATARAQLVIKGTKVYVVYDYARTTPVQLFSVGNTAVRGFNEVFLPMADRAASLEVQFSDAAQGYARDTITAVNINITEQAAARTQIALRGVTRVSQAWREAQYRLAKNELLKRSGEISVDIDAIACTIGDLVWVQNDVPIWGQGGRAGAGSTTTTLVLDKTVTIESGKTYELSVRLRDDTIVAKRTVVTPAGDVTSLAVSVAFPTAPEQYDVWAFGETNKSVKEFLVTEMVKDGDQRVKLGLLEYNASIHNIDLGIPTIPPSNISASTGAALTFFYVAGVAQPFIIEGMEKLAGGEIDVYADLQFGILRPEAVAFVTVYGSISGLPQIKLGTSRDNTFRVHGLISGSTYGFTVVATNQFGNEEPVSLGLSDSKLIVGTTAIPLDVTGFAAAFDGVGVTLTWNLLTEVDIDTYEVTNQLGATVCSVNAKQFSLLANGLTPGAWTWSIRAKDTTNHYSATPATASLTVLNPATPTLTPAFNGPTLFNNSEIGFVWTSSETSLPLDYYDVRYSASGGSWAAGTSVGKIQSRLCSLIANWVGVRRFWVAGVDAAGNTGTAGYIDVDITIPAAVTINSPTFEADLFVLTWTPPTAVLPIREYEVFYSSTSITDPLSGGTSLGTTKATRFIIPAKWSGSRRWWLRAIDVAGNPGTVSYVDKTLTIPPMPSVTQQVIDNNVLIKWGLVAGSLPTDTYEIRRGDVFSSATVIGTKSGAFTSVFENLAGTYTYWVVAIDTAGNYGTEGSVAAKVNQPPDFILANQTNSSFAGTKVAALVQTNGTLLLPVNITETWSDHFTVLRVSAMAVASGGSGYAVGNKIRLNTGTTGFHATATVASISGSAVTALTLVGPGNYTVAPSAAGATVALTGTGTGLTVNPTYAAWASPNDQVNAGFPVMIQPYPLSASYQEPDIDMGQSITSQIQVTYTGSAFAGAPVVGCTISISPDGSTWTDFPGVTALYETFRYVRVKLDVTAYGDDAYTLADLIITVAAKLHSEVGTVTATGATGTIVNFPSEFLSVTSIVTSAQQSGTITPVITVHNFRGSSDAITYSVTSNVCTVNLTAHDFLTGQKVKLSFLSGTGVNGIYTITGVTANTFTVAMTTANTSGSPTGSCISQSMRVYAFNYSTGAAVTCDVGWTVKGY